MYLNCRGEYFGTSHCVLYREVLILKYAYPLSEITQYCWALMLCKYCDYGSIMFDCEGAPYPNQICTPWI